MTSDTAPLTRSMTVPAGEIAEVRRLAWHFCPIDERYRPGSVLLTDVGGVRSWLMGHRSGLISLSASSSTGSDDWVIPKRLIHGAAITAAGAVTFSESTLDGGTVIAACSETTSITLPLCHDPEPALACWANAERAAAATATLPAPELARLVAAARCTPYDVEDDEALPLFWVELANGRVTLSIDWGTFGRATYAALGRGTGSATAAANPAQLADVLEVFDDDVTVELSADPKDPIILRSSDRRALITPIWTTCERWRERIESLLSEAFGDLAVIRDDDGDYPLRRHGTPVHARLIDDQPARLQVFAELLDGIAESPELYRELNALNTSVRFARLTLVDGRLCAEVDLVAETVDTDELVVAVDRIVQAASDLAPAVGAYFGGVQHDPLDDRWERYRSTIILAETLHGRWLALSGPEACDEWDLPEEVFVLSASNPAGTTLTDEDNERANVNLSCDILRCGGRVVGSLGCSPDGSHVEGGVVMWDLPLDAALFYGRKYGQDAIFRVTADEIELVSCVDDRREVLPRRAAA
jgi:hypothetical protein